jgi:FkbM family methyltransferase
MANMFYLPLQEWIIMGLNLIKFASDYQYRALKRWKWCRGDDTLLTDFEFDSGDTVIEGGCYLGDFTRRIATCGEPRVIGFEPIPEFFEKAQEATIAFPNVAIHCAGLSDRNAEVDIFSNGESSSAYRRDGKILKTKMRSIVDVVVENHSTISLLALNVEGEEYAIIEKLIETSLMSNINTLIVQFHLINEKSMSRYDAISKNLAKSHIVAWRFPFIWERWDLASKT